MSKSTKYIIIGLSVLSISGIGYFIYSKIKIAQLNKKISSVEDAATAIDSIDVSNVEAAAYEETEPTLPPVSDEFDGSGDMVGDLQNTNWDDAGGYFYLFPDGSQDYYLADGTYVESRDANGDISS